TGLFAAGAFNLVNVPLNLYNVWNIKRNQVRFTTHDGALLKIGVSDLVKVRLVPDPDTLTLEVPIRGDFGRRLPVPMRLTGADAEALAAMLMPKANRRGASASRVREAVDLIDHAGGSEAYLSLARSSAERWGVQQSWGDAGALWYLPKPVKLALEMSLHEEVERAALEGELSMLE